MINPFKTKLSRRLLLSFAVVSAIPMSVGVVALVNMREVTAKTGLLARDYIPQVRVASEIEGHCSAAMYAMRGYQLTGESKYLADADAAFVEIERDIPDAEKLTGSEVLIKLKADLPELKRLLEDYKRQKRDTVENNARMHESQSKLNRLAESYDAEIRKFTVSETDLQKAEIDNPATTPKQHHERSWKLRTMAEVAENLNEVRVSNWKAQATRDRARLEAVVKEAFTGIEAKLTELRARVTQREHIEQIERIREAMRAYHAELTTVLELWARGAELGEARNLTAQGILKKCAEMTDDGIGGTLRVGTESNAKLDAAGFVMLLGISLGVILTAVVAVSISMVIYRTLTSPLEYLIEGTNKLAVSASEISSTTTQLASNSMETSASVSEISATVEEVRQTAQICCDKAQKVATQADKLTESVDAGRTASKEAIEGMARIKQEMEYIAESIIKLSEQTQNIGEITGAVNDLADQSNLLSVNAAIEAAKAGEYGKGFAVVAQEVKNLAEQSKEATNQIKAILGDIQKATGTAVMATERGTKAVDAGAALSTQASATIGVLLENVKQGASASLQIAASSQQQLVGMDQLVTAMRSIKDASSQNVSGTKQLEQAAQNLNELGGKLKEISRTYSA